MSENEENTETEEVEQRSSRILVIDEEEGARTLLKRRLSIHGYEVLTVSTAEDGARILQEKSIDVIFLNVILRGKSGYDFLKELKADNALKNIGVIMMSSDGDIELIVRCIESGAEDYLVKPFNQTLLRARLSNCIAKKEAYDKEIAYKAKIEQGQKQIVAQEKMASVGVLVSSISQELKNPLNFVINFASVSSDTCGDLVKLMENQKDAIKSDVYDSLMGYVQKFRSNVSKISEYGRNADKIIRFMLDQSNSSGDKKHPSSINKVILQTITMFLSTHKTNGITIFPKINQNFDENIRPFPIAVQSISKAIFNILDNSIYALEKKFPTNLAEGIITITTREYERNVEITIHDNGIGIPQEIHGKVFAPFFTTKVEGVNPGLGLATTKEIITEHEGEISVKSIVNDYTEIIFTIQKTSDL